MPLALGGLALLLVVLGASSRRRSPSTTSTMGQSLGCRDDLVALKRDGRARQTPSLIVIHSTEGTTAASAANWFMSPDAQGSAHVVVGEDGCYRTLPDAVNAAGAGEVNPRALHLEFAGFAGRGRSWWLSQSRTLEQGARQIAEWSRLYGIPLQRIGVADLRAGRAGVATHADVVAAFSGTHWDPGPGFPLDVVLARARAINGAMVA